MKPTASLAYLPSIALVAMLACACARNPAPSLEPLPNTPEAEAAGRLKAGAAALEIGNFSAARTDLGWVYTHCPSTDDGQSALLLLAAGHLDPRNGDRRPDLAAAMAAHVAGLAAEGSVLGSASTSLFMLSREQGAPRPNAGALEEAVREVRRAEPGCGATEARASLTLLEAAANPPATDEEGVVAEGSLPDLAGLTVPEQIAALSSQRDSLASRVTELEAQVRGLTDRVAIQQQELERIRRTLRP
ncbi:MAG TPA: hypothetical protein VML95_01365 [Longimicrobiales bacterium]|nr:hypothetical protein [Longimicrobiales bacterium]